MHKQYTPKLLLFFFNENLLGNWDTADLLDLVFDPTKFCRRLLAAPCRFGSN